MVQVYQHVILDLSSDQEENLLPTPIPPDEEVIQDEGWSPVNRISVTRHCFLSVDRRHHPSQLTHDLESLRQRLFDGGSPILRPGFAYRIRSRSIALSLSKIAQIVQTALSDERNSHLPTMLFCVVSIHIIGLLEGTDAVNDEYDDEDEARILEESMESSAGFVARPASRGAVGSLGRTKVDGGDCAICFERLLPGDEHTSMPCEHVFHEDCIGKWLEMSHQCPLCRFSLPQEVNWGGT